MSEEFWGAVRTRRDADGKSTAADGRPLRHGRRWEGARPAGRRHVWEASQTGSVGRLVASTALTGVCVRVDEKGEVTVTGAWMGRGR